VSVIERYSPTGVATTFRRVDWDFANAWTRYGLSLVHWYPTKLTPQVASSLIAGLTEPGETVCDPFCGSGTVLAEAMRLRRRAVGVDISPVACLISTARTTLIPVRDFSAAIRAFLGRLHFGLGILNGSLLPLPITPAEEEILLLLKSQTSNPENKPLAHWFHPAVYRDICFATHCIALEPSPTVRTLLTAAFSSLLRACCGQSRSWKDAADNVPPKNPALKDIYLLCSSRLRSLERGMQIFIEQCTSHGMSIATSNKLTTVICDDTRHIESVPRGSVDCIITSPPCPGVTDHITSQRLSMLWLGHNPEELKHTEIGARWKRHRKESLQEYLDDMSRCLIQIHRLLRDEGRLAIVIDSSRARTRQSEATVALTDFISGELKMERVGSFGRQTSRLCRLDSSCTRAQEILIYRKRHG
jgi:hypothetical protein